MMRYPQQFRGSAFALAVAAFAALTGTAGPLETAAAYTIRQAQVTGHVTAIAGNGAISVDGHQYLIGAGTLASQNVGAIHIGDMVSLVFDGPPSSSASHVVLIQPLPGGQAAPGGQ